MQTGKYHFLLRQEKSKPLSPGLFKLHTTKTISMLFFENSSDLVSREKSITGKHATGTSQNPKQ